MIIVSDDKTYFVNFDNVTQISIGINDKEEYGIIVTTTNDDEFPLAVYKTEKRAKEVLDDIVNNYNITPLAMIYRMPKE